MTGLINLAISNYFVDPEHAVLRGSPPFAPWMVHKLGKQCPSNRMVWGVRNAAGNNCISSPTGGVMVKTRDEAIEIIARLGFEPAEDKWE